MYPCIEGSVTPENVRKWAVEIVTRLRSLAQIRDEMKQFKLAVQCAKKVLSVLIHD